MKGYNSTSSGNQHDQDRADEPAPAVERDGATADERSEQRPTEFGGRKKGLEPTRYGDWEKDGRCIDF